MRRFALLLLPALCWSASTSITIDQLITMARAVPPEFSAEALIRIAAIDKVEKTRKIDLLEEAFRRAGDAQLPYKRRASIVKVAGPAGVYNRTAAQGLDALSLRLKAVRAMLLLDAARARDLFRRIPPLKLPALACEEYLVYDVDAFYDALSHVSRETLTPAEIEKGEELRLIEPYLNSITSPVQLPGAARLIAGSTVNDKDFQTLMAAFSKVMVKIKGDDRSFSFAPVGPPIRAIVEAAEKRKLPAAPLLEAYRLYIVNNMAAARCADDDLMVYEATSFAFADPRAAEQQGPDPSAYFNDHLRVPPLQEIKEVEVTPSKLEGVATGLRGCDDEACKSIVLQYTGLIFDADRNPLPFAKKETPEWQGHVEDLLTAMAGWKPVAPSAAAEHFREKSSLYSDLVNIQPNTAGRIKVLRAELQYVVKDKAGAESRAQWFLPINGIIGRVTLDPLGLGVLSDDLRNSGDPIITLFTELDAIAPRRPDLIMPLI
ncbi:MAG TPA: hypothetical protein VML19_12660 [Verrucomicrobiae bacterium]|nr:hypothetical protein [Verrucomicrobiae bacterium]